MIIFIFASKSPLNHPHHHICFSLVSFLLVLPLYRHFFFCCLFHLCFRLGYLSRLDCLYYRALSLKGCYYSTCFDLSPSSHLCGTLFHRLSRLKLPCISLACWFENCYDLFYWADAHFASAPCEALVPFIFCAGFCYYLCLPPVFSFFWEL